MISAAIGIVILFVGVPGYFRWRRRWILALDWPGSVGLNQFSSLVMTYLKHNGWIVETPPIARHIMIVKKGNEIVRLICLPTLVQYDGAKIRDLSQLATGPRQLVCITTSDASSRTKSTAAAGKVLLLHYKKLDMFAASRTDQAALLDAMREQLLEKHS